ncbi:MAG TPA: class I adenylate-forming enzyme family protein [Sphingomonas sp.]|nr:class I adenylate-forming enzyme family protein [Sphingomonas sp.]
MTVDYIAYHALTRPDAVAIIHDDRRITYADFHRDVRRFMRAAQEFDLSPGAFVAVGCEDFYAHWLLLLAFERLGIATASLAPHDEAPSTAPLLSTMDLVLSDTEIPARQAASRYQPITSEWLGRAARLPPLDVEPSLRRKPDDVIRILRTSGTTGVSKRMLLRRRMHEARLANWSCFGITRQDRYFVSMPFTMHATYSMATAYIRAGAIAVQDGRGEVGDALIAHDIDHVILMPKQLRHVLDHLPGGNARPRHLMISSLGAPLPTALRARALSQLAAEVLDLYACNEAALVSLKQGESGTSGALWPGVQVETLDEGGNLLPPGQAGMIRIATEAMVEGYVDDPETTARMFRDGWFYPGDIGVLDGGRRLQVLGRADELLNIGGEKYAPEHLEEWIMTETGIDAVGLCTIADANGVEQLCIAVSGAVAKDKRALERIAQVTGAARSGNVTVVGVDKIPRTPNGKIQRALLKSAVLEALRRAGAI